MQENPAAIARNPIHLNPHPLATVRDQKQPVLVSVAIPSRTALMLLPHAARHLIHPSPTTGLLSPIRILILERLEQGLLNRSNDFKKVMITTEETQNRKNYQLTIRFDNLNTCQIILLL